MARSASSELLLERKSICRDVPLQDRRRQRKKSRNSRTLSSIQCQWLAQCNPLEFTTRTEFDHSHRRTSCRKTCNLQRRHGITSTGLHQFSILANTPREDPSPDNDDLSLARSVVVGSSPFSSSNI